jgi:hypothetical protein
MFFSPKESPVRVEAGRFISGFPDEENKKYVREVRNGY